MSRIVDDVEDEIVFESDGPMAITGDDDRVAFLTTCFRLAFPKQFERFKGDADELYIEKIEAEADDTLRVSYTTVENN